ncbi:MAG TPA: LCP family protein [Streptosporangiaceae bacterium]|nr:LCP family protein [Streptosporangiaceae bacterium]
MSVGLAVALVGTSVTAYILYQKLQRNVRKEHVTDQLGPNRPAKLNKSMNILLLGSDSRDGANRQYWSPDISGQRSDTTILLHLSPNRDRAVAVSFPRDSMVRIPACEQRNGTMAAARFGQLNAAFAVGGATCTWKTLESLTNIHIDHYAQIDFAGFKRVVDALGGVEICVSQAVNDPRADLRLKAGRQVVKGDQALGYVRARYSLGDGSDLERIQRQQRFMASVVNKATSTGMLANPARTYSFLDAVTKSISTDDEFTFSVMRKLASSLKGMSAGTVRFVTVPTRTYPKDPNRVQWDMAHAGPLFEAIRQDATMPAAPAASPTAVPPGAAANRPLPKPGKVKVTVLGPAESARPAVAQLKAHGFAVAKVTARPPADTTQIRYGPGAGQQAAALAALIPEANPVADPKGAKGMVYLVIGRGGVRLQNVAIPKVGGEVSPKQDVCKD